MIDIIWLFTILHQPCWRSSAIQSLSTASSSNWSLQSWRRVVRRSCVLSGLSSPSSSRWNTMCSPSLKFCLLEHFSCLFSNFSSSYQRTQYFFQHVDFSLDLQTYSKAFVKSEARRIQLSLWNWLVLPMHSYSGSAHEDDRKDRSLHWFKAYLRSGKTYTRYHQDLRV